MQYTWHESAQCTSPPCCVNCKKKHPFYAKSCEKWKNKNKIQIIRTKENIFYPNGRKLVESRTPIVGVSYAAAVSKTAHKTYKTIATQTESPTEKNCQSLQKEKIPTNSSHISKSTHSNIPKSQTISSNATTHPIFPKLPLQKQNSHNTSKTPPLKQNHRSDFEKHHKIQSIKSSSPSENLIKKKK